MIKNIIKRTLKKISKRHILKQEAILRLALQEENIDDRKLLIEIDHINGFNYINSIKFPIIYPRSFFLKASEINNLEKEIDFYFNGNMDDSGERKKLLSPFEKFNSVIIESNFGRDKNNKVVFNNDYFIGLSKSKFGLCPHQKDFKGNPDTMWTYRFIESCMCKSIPLLFNETPLGKSFTDGFYTVNDSNINTVINDFSEDKTEYNYELCKKKHSFTNLDYIEKINGSIKKHSNKLF